MRIVGDDPQPPVEVDVLTASGEGSIGENGGRVGAGANLIEGALTLGGEFERGDTNESNLRIGLGAGPSLAARMHWADTDHDDHREYGVGMDLGPITADYRSEDPVRSLAASTYMPLLGPGAFGVDWLLEQGIEATLGDVNLTDEIWNWGGRLLEGNRANSIESRLEHDSSWANPYSP
jgi:hypothetical protein